MALLLRQSYQDVSLILRGGIYPKVMSDSPAVDLSAHSHFIQTQPQQFNASSLGSCSITFFPNLIHPSISPHRYQRYNASSNSPRRDPFRVKLFSTGRFTTDIFSYRRRDYPDGHIYWRWPMLEKRHPSLCEV